jgi:hypothetical protein
MIIHKQTVVRSNQAVNSAAKRTPVPSNESNVRGEYLEPSCESQRLVLRGSIRVFSPNDGRGED